MARIEFLGPLKQVVDGQEIVEVQATTVAAAIDELNQRYEGLSGRLLTENGSLHQHINIYVNEEDIRFKGQLQTALLPGDAVTVISAIAGG